MRTKVEGRFSMLLLAFAVVVLIAALAMGLAVKAEAQTAPTIPTDKEDYPPGALTTLPG